MKKISIIGMGYVGLPLAVAFQKFFKVTGFDLQTKIINDLNKGLDKNSQFTKKRISKCSNLTFTHSTKDLDNTDLFIVTVPTPIYKNKDPDLRHLINACKLIGKKIKKKQYCDFRVYSFSRMY